MTALYYVMDGDDILVFTMAARAKAKAVRRNPKVSLCVLDENWPPTYLTVYCDATIDATVASDPDAVTALSNQILEVMAGRKLDPRALELSRDRVISEDRVKLRLRPYSTFMTPPRHVYSEADVKGLTHWTSTSMPW